MREPRRAPPIRCALVGCGTVAEEYAQAVNASALVRLVACVDLDRGRAHAFAARHGTRPAAGLREVLASDQIDLVIVLAPPAHHGPLAHKIVTAGKSVYVEKPLTLDLDGASQLLTAARTHGVLVGAAPDTFLSAPFQTAKAALAEGLIGRPIAAMAALLSPGPERWHPEPAPFYTATAGPLFDMGPYYLTVLAHLLGPLHVTAAAASRTPTRLIREGPRAGSSFVSAAPTHVNALLTAEGGVPVTVTTSFDVHATRCPHLEIYGSEGTLMLPDPNFHHGAVLAHRRDEAEWHQLAESPPDELPQGRGLGVVDTARALLGHERHRATGHLAAHVLAVMTTIKSIAQGNNMSDASTHPEYCTPERQP